MSISARSLIFLPVLLAATAPATLQPPAPQPSIAGTWRIAVCKRQPCAPDDSANVLVGGTLVLSDTTYGVAAFPDSLRFSLLRFTRLGPRNGCSITAARRPAPGTFAGIGGVELLAWTQQPPNRVALELHQSADFAYRMQLTVAGDQLRGTGKSWGASGATPAYSDDIIVGRRVGPPDHQPCADSAMAALRKRSE
jgi:hypothetical protein